MSKDSSAKPSLGTTAPLPRNASGELHAMAPSPEKSRIQSPALLRPQSSSGTTLAHEQTISPGRTTHLSRSPPIRSNASSMTTELPRITTIPSVSLSPLSFSSTALSRTMFRNTCRYKRLARLHFLYCLRATGRCPAKTKLPEEPEPSQSHVRKICDLQGFCQNGRLWIDSPGD